MEKNKARPVSGDTPSQISERAAGGPTGGAPRPADSVADRSESNVSTRVMEKARKDLARLYTGGLHASIYRPNPPEAYWWEDWWGRRPHTTLAAAYQRGRYLNQLNWYCQLAVLISFWERPYRYRQGVRTAAAHQQPIYEIRRHLRRPGGETRDFATRMSKEFIRFLLHIRPEAAQGSVRRVFKSLERLPQRNLTKRTEACVELNDLLIKPFIKKLRSLLKAELTTAGRSAFCLGEKVDAGVRRPDVCAFLNPEIPDPRFVHHPLINFTPVAGSLLPERAWSKGVLVLMSRLGIDGVLKPLHSPSSPLQFMCGPTVQARGYAECTELALMVDVVDELIYASLCARKAGWFHEEHEMPPALYQYGGARGRLKDFAKWFDLDERTVKGKAEAGIFWVRRLSRYEYEIWFKSQRYEKLCAQSGEITFQGRNRGASPDAV